MQTLQKPNYTFGGSQNSQHKSPGPFVPSRTSQRDMPSAGGSSEHGPWLATGYAVSAGQTHPCISPLHAERPLHVSSLPQSW